MQVQYSIELVGIITFLLGLIVGGFILWIILRQKINLLEEKISFTKNSYESLTVKLEDELFMQAKTYEDKIQLIESNFDETLQFEKDTKHIHVENLKEKIELLENSKDKLKQEFENLANRLFEENSKKSTNNLSLMLNPFKEQLSSFGKRVDDIYNEETKQRSSLLTEIKNLKELNNQISQDAINLTKALKGENKTQGDWGELILSKILEQTGLREGIEYSTQGSFTDSLGRD